MGLSEFENELKQRLEERTITPSGNAWDKVVGQLEEEKSTFTLAKWYWVAAILIIGGFVLGGFLISQKTAPKPTIVDVDVKKEAPVENNIHKREVDVTEGVVEVAAIKRVNDKTENKVEEVNSKTYQKPDSKLHIVEVASVVPVKLEKSASDVLEDAKVDKVLLTLNTMQEHGTEITDATIDSLLLNAQNELRAERIQLALANNNNATESLAASLLSEVEYELDKSFKDKVFNALQDGFIKIKTAVAEK
ncbi:hypothetical protein [Neptunitalea lumnitzerae]|uniref:Anti-sigma factor n=1 Tax=Neptunitalea lumnitzerae TaxID=2965509 RepID=A0ABQ5MIE6_9FLAO|nr:hypothetical protein [Neptunitalea sp. Y10]GLB49076.1 hypothetical protein Y10_14440 [Neptunitalea sp. Y10]